MIVTCRNMGALYEDVENFFGEIFDKYGKFVANYPLVFILISLVSCTFMGLGILNISYETRSEKLYSPSTSQSVQDLERLQGLFPDRTKDAFYRHQLIWQPSYAEVLFRSRDAGNLTEADLGEVAGVDVGVRALTVGEGSRGHDYTDVCAQRRGQCVVEGGNLSSAEGASSLLLRYQLRHDTPHQVALSLLWEQQFLRYLHHVTSPRLHVTYGVSQSHDLEVARDMQQDVKFFIVAVVLMVVYASLVTTVTDWVSCRVLLAWAGVLSVLLGIWAAFGILCLCGVKFIDICGVMPFLMLGQSSYYLYRLYSITF